MSFKFVFFRVIPFLIIFMAVISFIAPDIIGTTSTQEIWVVRIISLLIIAGIVFFKILFYRCKMCKKWFAMKKSASQHIGTDSYTSREQTGETRSDDGRVVQTHHTDVEYIRDVHKVTYSCKYCGARKYREKTGKYRKS
ncbi:MAG: hypothetical protein LBD23_16420 [Oscillospiraceae bacterium]|nr:hypothetical protein [Oscillospiraceae bacterium]